MAARVGALGGYLLLAERMAKGGSTHAGPYNFGPDPDSNQSVQNLLDEVLKHWPGRWRNQRDPLAPHEAGLLQLEISKARHQLGWEPRWNFATTVARTIRWYRAVHEGANPIECCLADLVAFNDNTTQIKLPTS